MGLLNQIFHGEGGVAKEIILDEKKRLKPSFGPEQAKEVILIFRKAYDLGHFDDLESESAT